MTTVLRIDGLPVQFGGEEHSGWLPPGAAKPLPTPIENLTLDLEIQSADSGFLLCWVAREGGRSGDTWHGTLEDAKDAARDYFGINPDDWRTSNSN